ncbi:hypothetical protein WDU94_005795 [Cyamophila willieti]
MIQDNIHLKQIKIFTTMLGHKSSFVTLKHFLIENPLVKQVSYTEFCQGNTMRWGLAWTAKDDIKLPSTLPSRQSGSSKSSKPVVTVLEGREGGMRDVVDKILALCDTLQIIYKILHERKDGSRTRLELTAYQNTWSHQRRLKRMKRKLENDKLDNENNEENSAKRNEEKRLKGNKDCDETEKDVKEDTENIDERFVGEKNDVENNDNECVVEEIDCENHDRKCASEEIDIEYHDRGCFGVQIDSENKDRGFVSEQIDGENNDKECFSEKMDSEKNSRSMEIKHDTKESKISEEILVIKSERNDSNPETTSETSVKSITMEENVFSEKLDHIKGNGVDLNAGSSGNSANTESSSDEILTNNKLNTDGIGNSTNKVASTHEILPSNKLNANNKGNSANKALSSAELETCHKIITDSVGNSVRKIAINDGNSPNKVEMPVSTNQVSPVVPSANQSSPSIPLVVCTVLIESIEASSTQEGLIVIEMIWVSGSGSRDLPHQIMQCFRNNL